MINHLRQYQLNVSLIRSALSYPILSYPILFLSYPILSYPLYYFTLPYPILLQQSSYPIPFLSYPILSYPILYILLPYPILSYCSKVSYPILSYCSKVSYLILSYPILSYPIANTDSIPNRASIISISAAVGTISFQHRQHCANVDTIWNAIWEAPLSNPIIHFQIKLVQLYPQVIILSYPMLSIN